MLKKNLEDSFFTISVIDKSINFLEFAIDLIRFQLKNNACNHVSFDAPPTSKPICKWRGTKIKLTEMIIGIFYCEEIDALPEDDEIHFNLFCKAIGNIFGVQYKDPHDDKRKFLQRKRLVTPMIDKMRELLIKKIKEYNP